MLNQSPSDTLDRLVGLLPQSQTYAARREREKVVFATQGSEDGLFDPALPGLSVEERLYVALYACLLTPSPDNCSYTYISSFSVSVYLRNSSRAIYNDIILLI